MATYKVPQDVEADDKLIGPFSFRQFLYLLAVAMAIAIAWGLAQIFVGLAIIPLPVILFFGALALPLRKDQPMEIYMAAIVSFYLKPRQRLWDPEGIESLIEVSAPKTIELQRTKDLTQTEAARRLSYLADIVDSGGWAIRGVSGTTGTAMNNDVYLEAQGAEDVLDTNTTIAHSFDQLMQQRTEKMHQEAVARMSQATTPQPVAAPAPAQTPQVADPLLTQMSQQIASQPSNTLQSPHFDPYPNFRQTIIQPLDEAHQAESDIEPTVVATPAEAAAAVVEEKPKENTSGTSDTALSADIINLANNPDLSIETIAHEANRLKKKAAQESEEVIISLR